MKTVCPVCEQVFEASTVLFEEGSGVYDTGEGDGFRLIPEHPPVPDKATSFVFNVSTKKIDRVMCGGTWRPVKISRH